MSRSQLVNTYKGQAWFHGLSVSSIGDLDSQIKTLEERRERLITNLKISVALGADNIKDGVDPIQFINDNVNCWIDEYEDVLGELYNLYAINNIISDWMNKENISRKEAFDKAVVDMYEDLRKEIDKIRMNKENDGQQIKGIVQTLP